MQSISRRTFLRRVVVGSGALVVFANGGFHYVNAAAGPEVYKLRVLHTNDHHARIEPVVEAAATPPRNHGGVARRKTLIDRIRTEAAGQNLLLLDAGDVFQGTLYYNQFKGDADVEFYNLLQYDAMAIGNHEFDDGQQVLANFIDKANFPVLSANITVVDSSPLKGKIEPRIVKTLGGEKIGIFGLTTEETPTISSPGQGVTFDPIVAAAQAQVDALKAEGVNKIIALTHVGFGVDQQLAAAVSGIDLIIGGHSHTPLGPQPNSNNRAYPTIVNAPDGNQVVVITDWEWGRWLGDITVGFDAQGVVTQATGTPIEVLATATDATPPGIAPNPELQNIIDTKYKPQLDAIRNTPVGETRVALTNSDARIRETLLGNLITDAMLDKTKTDNAQIVITNGGGIRANIDPGPVNYGQVLEVLPFGNTLARVDLTGAQLKEAIEHGVSRVGAPSGSGRFPQVAGLRFSYTPSLPPGSRVTKLEIKSGETFAPLDPAKTYRVITNNFMLNGGDGYVIFAQGTNQLDLGFVMADVVADYIKAKSPITPQLEGRIEVTFRIAIPIIRNQPVAVNR
jgi:5'-nucleotidase